MLPSRALYVISGACLMAAALLPLSHGGGYGIFFMLCTVFTAVAFDYHKL